MKKIFVFGSNLSGRHGRGAALEAIQKHGAVYGNGQGLQGNSYAIPTKDYFLRSLPLSEIKLYVATFLLFAESNLDKQFFVTAVGTGLAGYKHEDIAPFFKNAPRNCELPQGW